MEAVAPLRRHGRARLDLRARFEHEPARLAVGYPPETVAATLKTAALIRSEPPLCERQRTRITD